jgi:hypothetical protein
MSISQVGGGNRLLGSSLEPARCHAASYSSGGFFGCWHVNQSIVATRASEILGMALLFALSRLELHYADSRVALWIQTNNGLGFRRGPPGWIWIVLTHEYILMQRKDI